MEDLTVVYVLQAEADLREPVKDLALREVPSALLLDHLLEIAAVRVVHYNAELALLGLVDLAEADDVRVVERLQYFGLLQRVLPLVLAHLADVNLLDYSHLFDGLALD